MVNLSDFKQIHCIGIGGIGLSAIAEILLSRGYKVTGSDMRESDITAKLQADGAVIYIGHRAENVDGADLLVYSAADLGMLSPNTWAPISPWHVLTVGPLSKSFLL